MEIGDAKVVQPSGCLQDGGNRIRTVHAARGDERRQAHTGALGADLQGNGRSHFEQKACAVVARATVVVFTQVGGGAQELVDQIAVACMDFNTIETGCDGIVSGPAVVLDHRIDVFLA
ncbi:hypothetical protein D3C80_1818760 [compost metagenome]